VLLGVYSLEASCGLCGRDLAGPGDPVFFDEPAYTVRLMLTGEHQRGRRYLITCPSACAENKP
jgi:hypothetical protein